MIAVIQTGGKQYIVAPGQKIEIEKLPQNVGEAVIFDKVLLLNDGKKTEVGMPYLEGVKVSGKILAQEKDDKILVLKFRNKVRRNTKKGHRQQYTVVEITDIK